MRATEFLHYINIDSKELPTNRNLERDLYTHMTIRMKVKRARYIHQKALKEKS